MAGKKKQEPKKDQGLPANAHIIGAGLVEKQPITKTLETNFMPYAMSVILSRAIPEIDGFKPSHRKLLYTMYKMGLITGARMKSANIVGRTMQLNPHGDQAIYDTMVRLSKGYEALLHPFVDSKGNFGKSYSRDMQWAASRYTEAKLSPICAEIFKDIDKDTVDFVDNYDNTMKEPALLPVSFPTILVNANTGIAVGMASSFCSFNLTEVCRTTIEMIKNPEHNVADTLIAPDFIGGAQLIYDRQTIEDIYASGRGSFKMRAKYKYDKVNRCIDITEIPPTTVAEIIIDKIIEKIKSGAIREISDIRDETDRTGLKITIDLKKGTDPDALMARLYKMTSLEDSFACNFNLLIAGAPKVLGVKSILEEWIAYRSECIKRRTYFDLQKAKDRLHLLRGLAKILLDIDKAISIIRKTDEESEVVPNLMIGFHIDKIQAEYVAEIKLRHLNREYILKRTEDIERLEKEIIDMEEILSKKSRVKRIIITELEDIIKNHGKERVTEIIYASDIVVPDEEEELPDYPVTLFFTREGYFKKILPQALRMSGEQKVKENDAVVMQIDAFNNDELLFFTNQCQVYKAAANLFDIGKASQMGDFVASKLEMDRDETAVFMAVAGDYKGYMIFCFENGKVAKVDISAYQTKTNRKKLIKAYSDKSPLAGIMHIKEDMELVIESSAGRLLLFDTGSIAPKSTKDTIGVGVMSLKKGHRVVKIREYKKGEFQKPYRYKTKNLPAAGALLSAEDTAEQLTMNNLQ